MHRAAGAQPLALVGRDAHVSDDLASDPCILCRNWYASEAAKQLIVSTGVCYTCSERIRQRGEMQHWEMEVTDANDAPDTVLRRVTRYRYYVTREALRRLAADPETRAACDTVLRLGHDARRDRPRADCFAVLKAAGYLREELVR